MVLVPSTNKRNRCWTYRGSHTHKVSHPDVCHCRARSCLHLVLCFSPVGDAFRQRLRMFPSLVNCTTIDWFSEWPVEALTSVARSFCADLELDSRGGDAGTECNLLNGVLAACVHIHQSVEAKSKQYYAELRR